MALRRWDRWLKGVANRAEADPPPRLWVQDSARPDPCAPVRPGRWVAGTRVPVSRRLALSPGGVGGGVGGALSLRVATPQDHGLMAGAHLPMGLDGEMPGDQRMDDALAVRFDATPEGKATDLIGRAVLRLRVTCDRPRAIVHARLCDVARDGASRRIAHGMLNLCHRNGMDAPAPVPVGVPFDLTIPLDAMAHRIAAGHRPRLALAKTCWPFLRPSPEAATVAVLSGTLKVPVVPGDPEGRAAPAPTGAPPGRIAA